MDTGAQCSAADGCVQVIGGDDGQQVDALGRVETPFPVQQRLPAGIHALRRQATVTPGFGIAGRVTAERPGHQVDAASQCRSLAVHLADKGAGTAADHAQPYS